MALRSTLILLLALAAGGPANAAVTYTLVGGDTYHKAKFSFITSDFIRPLTVIPFAFEPYRDAYSAKGEIFSASKANCTASATYISYTCSRVFFGLDVKYRDFPNRNDDVIAIGQFAPVFGGEGAGFLYFQAGAFSTPGTHVSWGGYTSAVLTVTSTGPAPVPEPTTWAMMIGGFGLAGAAVRHRTARVSYSVWGG